MTLLRWLGVILVLGGLAHSAGLVYFYRTHGVPAADRVLLHVWIAEAQIIGGAFYLAAFRARRAGGAWRGLAVAGALTVLAYAVPFIPVLFARAPLLFRIPPIAYALLSGFVMLRTTTSRRSDRERPFGIRAETRPLV